MASQRFNIIESTAPVRLVSTWSVSSSWDYVEQKTVYHYGYASTDTKTITVNLSAIPAGSKLVSATFVANTNKPHGGTYARCENFSINMTNNQASTGKDASAWVSSFNEGTWGTISILFTHQGYNDINSGRSQVDISSAWLDIEYELPNATGDLSTTDVTIGETITLSIDPGTDGYTKEVTWKFKDKVIPGTISNNQCSWKVPTSYVSDITTSDRAQASVELVTRDDQGNQVGTTQVYTFNIVVPASYVPSQGTLSLSVVDGIGTAAAQGRSKVGLSLSGAAGVSGSTIANVVFKARLEHDENTVIELTGTESNGVYTATTEVLTVADNYNITAIITDSRGRSVETARSTLTVYSYEPPVITAMSISRCIINSENKVQLDDSGNCARILLDVKYSSLNGNNVVNNSDYIHVYSREKTKNDTQSEEEKTFTVNWNSASISQAAGTAKNIPIIIGSANAGSVDPDKEYIFRITIEDYVGGSAEASETVQTTAYVLHFGQNGKSIGIGRAAASTANTLSVNKDWSVYMGDVNVAGLQPHLVYKGEATGNLSDYLEMGTYTVTFANNLPLNTPGKTSGQLIVLSTYGNEKNDTPQISQIYISDDASNIYTRAFGEHNFPDIWNKLFIVNGSSDNVIGVAYGGTGGDDPASAKESLGFLIQDVIMLPEEDAAEPDPAITAGQAILSANIFLKDGDIWEGIAILGASQDTDFYWYFGAHTTGYRSFARYGSNSTLSDKCAFAFANAANKSITHFTVSMLNGLALVEGQTMRGDNVICDFVISRSPSSNVVPPTFQSFKIVPSKDVAVGHGSSILMRKIH